MKRIHLLRCPHSSSLRRTSKYTSFLGTSGALHLDTFDQPPIVKLEDGEKTLNKEI